MQYFLLSKAMRFERFFDSIEEACEYIEANTGAKYFDYDYIKEHLKANNSYTYSGWGIDLAIYKRPLESSEQVLGNTTGLQNNK